MHSVTGKLNRAAKEHQSSGGNTMFFVDVSERSYDYQSKQTVYTNYSGAVFAKGKQIDYYRESLVEGSVVALSGSSIIVDNSYIKDGEPVPKLKLQDAKIEYINKPEGSLNSNQPSQSAPSDDFDDSSVPF